jgi:hypothetical protein
MDPALYSATLNNATQSEILVPEGRWVALHCDGDVTVSLWQTTEYVTLETISAPGKQILCTGPKMKLVTTSSVKIRLIRQKTDR